MMNYIDLGRESILISKCRIEGSRFRGYAGFCACLGGKDAELQCYTFCLKYVEHHSRSTA